MPRDTETEIKLIASPAMQGALRGHRDLAGPERTDTLRTTYFDTPGRRLGVKGASLRIREVSGGKREQTLKLAPAVSAAVRRREWSVEIPDDVPNARLFPRTAQSALRRLVGDMALHPFAVVETSRTTRTVRRGRSDIAVAFDTGIVRAGERHRDICEVELELVSGRIGDLIELARALPLGPDLRWSVTSKAAQSENLAFDLVPAAVHAMPPELRPAMTVLRGVQAIGWSCLYQLIANHEAIMATGEAEAIHQARVAVRRLRAAFVSFEGIMADAVAPVLRAELKAAAQSLGRVRDLDVLIARIGKMQPANPPAVEDLLRHLALCRENDLGKVRSLLAGSPFQDLLFAVAGWLETGDWLKGGQGGDKRVPLPEYAAHLLSRRRRKLRKRSARLDEATDKRLHRIRKEVRTLRYLAEFLASLYRGHPGDIARRDFVLALAKAQDALGEIQDAVAAGHLGDEVLGTGDPLMAARLREELRLQLDDAGRKRKKQLKRARRALQAAWDCPAWWR